MTEENRQRLYLLMDLLSAEYTEGKPVSELRAELWFNELKMYSIEIIEKAVHGLLRTRTFATYPKLSEIIQAIEGTSEDKSLTAWLQVKEAIARQGAYQSVQFNDPVIHTVIEQLGGWPKICEVLEDKLVWMQKDFERMYKLCRSWTKHPQTVLGLAHMMNAEKFTKFMPKPVQIGIEEVKEIEQ